MGQRGRRSRAKRPPWCCATMRSPPCTVREGQVIFGNIQRFVIYLLGCNLSRS
jgi:hypothetical protein